VKTLSVDEAMRQAKALGADDEVIARLRSWKARAMTSSDRRSYRQYLERFAMGRAWIEMALAMGINPGTVRMRYYARGYTLNQALKIDACDARHRRLGLKRRFLILSD
jgi:hypothetical protein